MKPQYSVDTLQHLISESRVARSFEGFGSETITKEDTSLFRSVSRLKKKFTAAGDVPAVLEQFFDHYQITGFCVKGFFSNSLNLFQTEISSTIVVQLLTKYCKDPSTLPKALVIC